MKTTLDQFQGLLFKAAATVISEPEARYFAQEEIENYLKRPIDERWLPGIVREIKSWQENPNLNPKVLAQTPGSILYDFQGLGASLKLKEIQDSLEKRAKKNGVALAAIRNNSGDHALSIWTSGLAKRNLIGLAFVNGGNSVMPYGGTRAMFGTNPMSYAIPTFDRPIIADMATSELAFFRFKEALDNKREVGDKTLVDESGQYTKNPKMAATPSGSARIMPMGGGFKGYAIVMLVEILAGALTRSKTSTLEKPACYDSRAYGTLIMAIDIASFTSVKAFKKSVTNMCQAIRQQRPAPYADKVMVPGDRSSFLFEKLKQTGVDIPEEIITDLKELATH